MRRWIVGTGALALGIMLLSGCSGAPDDASSSVAVDSGPAPAADMAPMKESVAQQVVITAWLTLRVDSVDSATGDIEALVRKASGMIQQQDLTTSDGTTSATITARVPAASLDAFLADIARLGTVETSSRQASDVTQQTIDLDARISALTASVTRLEELLAQTSNVSDLVAVETELANRRAELDSLVAQRAYLADQVAMSTATITLIPTVQSGDWQAPGFLSGMQNGINALIGLVGAAITALGFVLPFAIVIGIVGVPIVLLLVRRSRRHRG